MCTGLTRASFSFFFGGQLGPEEVMNVSMTGIGSKHGGDSANDGSVESVLFGESALLRLTFFLFMVSPCFRRSKRCLKKKEKRNIVFFGLTSRQNINY